jgi:hypothetical protein
MSSVLHPSHFQVNEAWIAFRLNDTPIRTEDDGSFNCVSLMDAASCYILGAELVPTSETEPSKTQARNLLQAAWTERKQFPKTLFLPVDMAHRVFAAEAKRLGIKVLSVPESQLLVFIQEARDGYSAHLERKAGREA